MSDGAPFGERCLMPIYAIPPNFLVEDGLNDAGLRVISHSKVPTNDGGLSLGQATVALATLSEDVALATLSTEEKAHVSRDSRTDR